MKLTESQIKDYNLRKSSDNLSSFMFKVEEKPGLVKYTTISIGKKYRIENKDNKGVNGKVIEVICFVYEYGDDVNTSDPIGVGVNFLFNKKRGTYYDVLHLKEI